MRLMMAQNLVWWNITLYGSVFTSEVKQNFPAELFACQRLFYDLFIFTSFIFILTGGWSLLFSSSLSKTISLSESVVGLFKEEKEKTNQKFWFSLSKYYQEIFTKKSRNYLWGKKKSQSKLLLTTFHMP